VNLKTNAGTQVQNNHDQEKSKRQVRGSLKRGTHPKRLVLTKPSNKKREKKSTPLKKKRSRARVSQNKKRKKKKKKRSGQKKKCNGLSPDPGTTLYQAEGYGGKKRGTAKSEQHQVVSLEQQNWGQVVR